MLIEFWWKTSSKLSLGRSRMRLQVNVKLGLWAFRKVGFVKMGGGWNWLIIASNGGLRY
jgi:hypothetical protein